MALTNGIHHLGLAVRHLESTRDFFVNYLGWDESGYDASYPRTAVGDGAVRLTLWQVDHSKEIADFDMRKNIGLHHLALQIDSEKELYALADKLAAVDDVEIEFMPEFIGDGPRKHFICYEPGGMRIEFTWPG